MQDVFFRVSVFVGLGVLVVATPVSFIFINKLTNLQGDMLAHTDRRIALVNQLLAGMKSLKMYAWEAAQEARVRPKLGSLVQRRTVEPMCLLCFGCTCIFNPHEPMKSTPLLRKGDPLQLTAQRPGCSVDPALHGTPHT